MHFCFLDMQCLECEGLPGKVAAKKDIVFVVEGAVCGRFWTAGGSPHRKLSCKDRQGVPVVKMMYL